MILTCNSGFTWKLNGAPPVLDFRSRSEVCIDWEYKTAHLMGGNGH